MAKITSTGQKLLLEVATNPFRLVTAEELKQIIGKSINFVTAVKKAGGPFPGNVTRPEWIMEWLKEHPGFSIKDA